MAGDIAADVIDAIEDISGRHEGYRTVHAKGTLCAATFEPTGGAAELSKAAHFARGEVRAHVRFSNGSGNPHSRDAAQDARGMATKFYLPQGGTTDVIGLSREVFFVRTAEDFLEFTRARKPDPDTGEPDMQKIGEFLQAHPEAVPAVQEQLQSKPPVSYATVAYNSLHSYGLVDADGERRWARWRWEPDAGQQWLEEDEARDRDRDYLQQEIGERLEDGPAGFTLYAVLAEEGDPIDDPTQAWPPERERAEMGRLEVTGLAFDREREGDVLVFDPTRVTDGIELSGDPIVRARSEAYAESVFRRSGVRREA
jgi:catalase